MQTGRYQTSRRSMYDLTAVALALDNFRRVFGVGLNPEDVPSVWDRYLAEAQDLLDWQRDLADTLNKLEEEDHG